MTVNEYVVEAARPVMVAVVPVTDAAWLPFSST